MNENSVPFSKYKLLTITRPTDTYAHKEDIYSHANTEKVPVSCSFLMHKQASIPPRAREGYMEDQLCLLPCVVLVLEMPMLLSAFPPGQAKDAVGRKEGDEHNRPTSRTLSTTNKSHYYTLQQ